MLFRSVKGCGFHNNRVYLMTADNHFLKYAHDKSKADPFLDESRFDPTVLKKNVFYHIAVPDENFVFLLGEDGRLLSNNPPYEIESSGVAGMKLSERTKSLMYWTSSQITVAQLAEEVDVKALTMTKVFRGGQDIRQCFWALDASHIVCNDSDKVFLVEFEPLGVERSEFITSVKKGSSVFYTNETGCLYFIDEQGRFQKIQLLPKENVVQQFLNKGE